MPHPAARPAARRTVRRGPRALLTAAAALAATVTGITASGGTSPDGRHAGTSYLGATALGEWLRPRVAEASAGSVSSSLARALGAGRSSSTFARRRGAAGDAATGTGWTDLDDTDPARGARRPAALSVRQQLARAAGGTYIGELLARRDSALTRWPDRPDRPLAVFVSSGAGLADWRPEYVRQVASAFASWGRAGVPLQFRLVDDSARADVHVGWVDRFQETISGRTVWSRDDRWWMVDASVTLALHHSDGAPLDADQVRAIALHEVGHLLGLDHTADSLNVMAPRVRVRDLSAADQATARLLYSVPAGRVR